MNRWQFAWMTDQPQTTIGFSHHQPGLANELAAVLGPGLIMQASTEWSLSLDRMRVNLGYVSGLLGDRGWEMFAVETRLQPGAMSPAQLQTNWYFKRPAPDMPAAQQQPSAPMPAPSMPTAPMPASGIGAPATGAPQFPPPPGPGEPSAG